MTGDEVLDLLDGPIDSAAVGAALELGLFWLLEPTPLGASEIAERLGIPLGRCRAWLRVLEGCGLIGSTPGGFHPTSVARESILGTYSRDTWALLAQEARERAVAAAEMPLRLVAARPREEAMAEYVAAMAADPERAGRFTRMLYELHQNLAEGIAAALDLTDVRRILDLGGGSGVVAERLVRRWPQLSITVVDVANVCDAGRALVGTEAGGSRIDFRPGDFLSEELPGGYDAVLECDVGIYSVQLFDRVKRCLVPGGRFVIVDELPEDAAGASARWSLMHTLSDASWTQPTTTRVRQLLADTGFTDVRERRLESSPGVGGMEAGPVIVEATRAGRPAGRRPTPTSG